MIFPFEITRIFKLPDSEFKDYNSNEIIDRIYDNICNESLIMIKKENGIIEFKGDKSKIKFYKRLQWAMFTHCIDKGIVKIDDSKGQRKIIYTFQILNFLIWYYLPPMIIVFIISLFIKDFLLFWFVLTVNFFLWVFTIIIHPTLVSEPIDTMIYETIRRRGKKNYIE